MGTWVECFVEKSLGPFGLLLVASQVAIKLLTMNQGLVDHEPAGL